MDPDPLAQASSRGCSRHPTVVDDTRASRYAQTSRISRRAFPNFQPRRRARTLPARMWFVRRRTARSKQAARVNPYQRPCTACGTTRSCSACLKTANCLECTASARCGSCRNIYSKMCRAAGRGSMKCTTSGTVVSMSHSLAGDVINLPRSRHGDELRDAVASCTETVEGNRAPRSTTRTIRSALREIV